MIPRHDPLVALGSSAVLTLDGGPVSLGALWAKHPVVLALVRHFG